MRKIVNLAGIMLMTVFWLTSIPMVVRAEGSQLKTGISIGDIDVSGMTAQEAQEAVEEHVKELQNMSITLRATEGNEVSVSAADFGITWSNPEVIEEAMNIGEYGNIIARYKELKDLEVNGYTYEIEYSYDDEKMAQVLTEQCESLNQHAQNASIERVDDKFVIIPEVAGVVVDEVASIEAIKEAIASAGTAVGTSLVVDVVAKVEQPTGTSEDLAGIKDLLGSYTTSFSSSNSSRSANVRNGARLVDGTVVYPGEEFSFYDNIKPFTAENGYYMAGSYLSGMVVDSMGGGICQVSTTLYNAVLLAELEVTERHNHSMIVTYTQVSADAAISESSGKDFRFVNNTEYPIYIEGIATQDKNITFNIYGVESRDPNRTVKFENVILSTIHPDYERIIPTASQGVGFVDVQSAHIGYKAQLWKVVLVNGVEVSREQVNSSNYSMSPRTATVGINTANPQRQAEIMAAIGTGSIDHVRAVAAQLYAQEVAEANGYTEE